jgi:hypothetical protein
LTGRTIGPADVARIVLESMGPFYRTRPCRPVDREFRNNRWIRAIPTSIGRPSTH